MDNQQLTEYTALAAAAAERAEKATEGPWRNQDGVSRFVSAFANAAFIAASRQDVPALAAAVAALVEEVRRAQVAEQAYIETTNQDVMGCGHAAHFAACDGYEGYCVMCAVVKAQHENVTLLKIIAGERAENARLRQVIEMVEWIPSKVNRNEQSHCPWCKEHYADGHAPDCPRQEVLK